MNDIHASIASLASMVCNTRAKLPRCKAKERLLAALRQAGSVAETIVVCRAGKPWRVLRCHVGGPVTPSGVDVVPSVVVEDTGDRQAT